MAKGRRGSLASLPDQFGKYSLLGHLATGGMAEVYVARQVGLKGFEKIVVIKRVRPELEGDVETTDFFLDEARLVATLEHPNIAQVYEIGYVNAAYFFVMEYVHGADLRQVLEASSKRGESLPLGDAIYIASHVAAALHYAHEKRDRDGNELHIIHRDISPSNVLLSHDGAVKLCDFGIAKAKKRSAETTRGLVKGKYPYMSPEQCLQEPLDRRSDIFAMGTLLYELTTMTRLYKRANEFETLRAIIDEPPTRPSTRVADYPPDLERIVLRALAKKPADRQQTAQELQLELEDFAREHKLPQSSVRIANRMGALFEKRLDAWTRAKSQGKDLGEFLVDTVGGEKLADEGPTDVEVENEETRERKQLEAKAAAAAEAKPVVAPAPAKPKPRAKPAAKPIVRPSASWLVGAIVAVVVGVAAMFGGRWLPAAAPPHDFAPDVAAIATSIDRVARAGHVKADGIASAPILRAAISTDAATMHDVVTSEYVLEPGKGETIEIFQQRGDQLISLVRVPADAKPIAAMASGTRVDAGPSVVASAPIASATNQVAGVVAVATPVELAAVTAELSAHVAQAELDGLGAPIVLVAPHGAAGAAAIALALPPADWSANATLSATPLAIDQGMRAYLAPARYVGFGLAGLLLGVFVFGFVRRPR
ncbi:MAG TPA: serine/threonine-protein kinase [Kofleriaceae bacterium]|jgi:serine/threonine protein kinase